MKYRNGFVTNSSSSSFIISVDDISQDDLLNGPLKEFFILNESRWDDETLEEIEARYNIDKILNDDNSNYRLSIQTKDQIDEDDYWGVRPKYPDEDKLYYVIDNNCCCRFSFNAVDQVFNAYGIKWEYGYCD